MVYLAIKELALTAEDVIMVTASIMKDMQPNSEVIYRPNAIRALARIIDVSPSRSSKSPSYLVSVMAERGVWRVAVYGPGCGALLQGRNRRQEPIHLVRSPRLRIPPLPERQGRREAVGERGAGGG